MRALLISMVMCACAAPVSAEEPLLPEADCWGDGYHQPVDCTLQLDAFAERIGRADIRGCLGGAMLIHASPERIGAQCGYPGDTSVWGCYEPHDTVYFVIIRDDLSDADQEMVWDHELRHRASDCANGDWDFHHTGEFFR